VLSRQCLDRRIATQQFLEREVCAWNRERNTSAITVDWQFTTADARIKLKRLYPVIVVSEEDIPLPLAPAVALPPAKPEARRKTQSPRRGSLPVQETAMVSSRIVLEARFFGSDSGHSG
jgi:hypothetical protein